VQSIRSLTNLDCAQPLPLAHDGAQAIVGCDGIRRAADHRVEPRVDEPPHHVVVGNPGILGGHPAPHVAPVPRCELAGSVGRILRPARKPVPVLVHRVLHLGEAFSLAALGDEQVVEQGRTVHGQ
jgi:hypothetical protein